MERFEHILNLDWESYSETDLKKAGMHKYMEDQSFELMLMGYSIDGAEPKCIDLMSGNLYWFEGTQLKCKELHLGRHLPPKERIPAKLLSALTDPTYLKKAHNAPFEIGGAAYFFGIELDTDQWECTQVRVATVGLPLSLDGATRALKLETKKDGKGMALIRLFCIPCRPTLINGGRTRNLPHHFPEKWLQFIGYCIQDVKAEMAEGDKISFLPLPPQEKQLWNLDQKINNAGIRVDLELIHAALELNHNFRERLTKEIFDLTGITKPNAVKQIIKWLEEEEDISGEITSLAKEHIPMVLRKLTGWKSKRVLTIRQELSKTSVKKYQRMLDCVCDDGRIRGLYQFCGANRTWRWAGRGVQIHNLPKSKLSDFLLKAARDMVLRKDAQMLEMVFGAIPDTLSQLIRTAFIPSEGNEFIVSDYSAIEARVISWLANETWRLDVFKGDGKIYEATAARMFNVPLESVTKGSYYRDGGKIGELACIAEDQQVLTNYGLVKIQYVQPWHRVWDGLNWVNHGGVISKGKKVVYTYQGLTATKDHVVWVRGKKEPIDFAHAILHNEMLLITGQDRDAVLMYSSPFKMWSFRHETEVKETYDIVNSGPFNRFTVSNVLVHNCGFNGGAAAVLKMAAAVKIPIDEYNAQPIVDGWRAANPKIVDLWQAFQSAAIACIRTKKIVKLTEMRHYKYSYLLVEVDRGVYFEYRRGCLLMWLPSGRAICYFNCGIQQGKFGDEVYYWGLNQTTKVWGKQTTYGGKLVENGVQGIARDVLAHGLTTIDAAGIQVSGHVHDESINEAPIGMYSQEHINSLMASKAPWMRGLPLDAAGFRGQYYKKEA